jgi:acetyltransferase-like isoleucine patch superfamily enzyme
MTTDFDYRKLKYCGTDVRIAPTVYMKYPELVSIGNHVAIDNYCHFTSAMEIGSYIHIGPFCSAIGGRDAMFIMNDFSGLAAGCRIICGSDDYLGSGLTNPTIPKEYHAKLHIASVTLEKHVVLGTNCVVHPGVVIGEGSAVGSCSLVTKSLNPWEVYIGIPAKTVKPRDKDYILDLEQQLRDAGL